MASRPITRLRMQCSSRWVDFPPLVWVLRRPPVSGSSEAENQGIWADPGRRIGRYYGDAYKTCQLPCSFAGSTSFAARTARLRTADRMDSSWNEERAAAARGSRREIESGRGRQARRRGRPAPESAPNGRANDTLPQPAASFGSGVEGIDSKSVAVLLPLMVASAVPTRASARPDEPMAAGTAPNRSGRDARRGLDACPPLAPVSA